jgi:hypothetical protein
MAYTVSNPKVHSTVASQVSARAQPPAREALAAAQGISTAKPQQRASTSWGKANQRLAEAYRSTGGRAATARTSTRSRRG